MKGGPEIDRARQAVEAAMRAVLHEPSRHGQDMARDAKIMHDLAGALVRLEQARQRFVEHST
jgi:hypothetical protein